MVTKAGAADVYAFDGSEGILLEVKPEPHVWPRIHEAWNEFMGFVARSEAPPLSERDTRVRDDPEWLSAAASYLELRTAHDKLSTKLDAVKAQLLGLAAHANEEGGGVAVTRFWKRGAIDYKKISELQALDLDQYRAPAREEVRITTT